jgi:hypothetical protein
MHALDYDLETQRDLVFALAVIHNFSIDHNGTKGDNFFDWEESMATGRDGDDDPQDDQQVRVSRRQKKQLRKWRDDIAEALWTQYQEHQATQPISRKRTRTARRAP